MFESDRNRKKKKISACREIIRDIRANHSREMSSGVLKQVESIDKILETEGASLGFPALLSLLKTLSQILSILGDLISLASIHDSIFYRPQNGSDWTTYEPRRNGSKTFYYKSIYFSFRESKKGTQLAGY